MSDAFDTLIRNGLAMDGSGAPGKNADVALRGDRIAAIGDLSSATAKTIVDATNCVVCPGFIDAHSHSDAYLLIEPDAPSKVSQGVTTEVVGHCGASAAPLLGAACLPSDWASMTYPRLASAKKSAPEKSATWSTVAEYRALFEQVRPAVNAVLLVGHNTLRAGVMGYAPREATPAEIADMIRNLEQALDEGCSGLSTGLIYQPGRFSNADEITSLAFVTARRGGFYATHMRSEGARLLEAIDEVLDIGRTANIRVQISHLKTSGENNWGKIDDAFARIESAQREGVSVHADRYPYIAGGTDLDIVLPEWAATDGREAVLARLADAATAARIAAELDAQRPAHEWNGVMIGGTVHPDLQRFRGQTLTQVAAELGLTPGQALVRIFQRDELRTGGFFFGMSATNMRRIFGRPWVMVGSDASIRALQGPLAADHPHPRAYGSFPKFLRLIQDEKLMSLPEAVRRCTALPATAFGLQGRGQLAAGAFADVVIFDPAVVRDRATFAQPHAYAEGVKKVWVNGALCFDNGCCTGTRDGRVLKSAF
jgi:N-acyl-D-amino-acid deacylase